MSFPGNQSCDIVYVLTLVRNTTNRKHKLDYNTFWKKNTIFFPRSRQIPISIYCVLYFFLMKQAVL